MADFSEALQHLKQGLVVLSPGALAGYIVLDQKTGSQEEVILIKQISATFASIYQPTQKDILATDWVLTDLQERAFISKRQYDHENASRQNPQHSAQAERE